MLTRPKLLLHLEGGAIFLLTLLAYRLGHHPWGLYALLFLSPDLGMLGYLKSPRLGSATYNLFHTLTFPVIILLASYLYPAPALLPYSLIWISHIAFDRMLGYGLKYPTFFRDTHLGHV